MIETTWHLVYDLNSRFSFGFDVVIGTQIMEGAVDGRTAPRSAADLIVFYNKWQQQVNN